MSKKAYITPHLILTIMSTSDILTDSGDGFDAPPMDFFVNFDDTIHAPEVWFNK